MQTCKFVHLIICEHEFLCLLIVCCLLEDEVACLGCKKEKTWKTADFFEDFDGFLGVLVYNLCEILAIFFIFDQYLK